MPFFVVVVNQFFLKFSEWKGNLVQNCCLIESILESLIFNCIDWRVSMGSLFSEQWRPLHKDNSMYPIMAGADRPVQGPGYS